MRAAQAVVVSSSVRSPMSCIELVDDNRATPRRRRVETGQVVLRDQGESICQNSR